VRTEPLMLGALSRADSDAMYFTVAISRALSVSMRRKALGLLTRSQRVRPTVARAAPEHIRCQLRSARVGRHAAARVGAPLLCRGRAHFLHHHTVVPSQLRSAFETFTLYLWLEPVFSLEVYVPPDMVSPLVLAELNPPPPAAGCGSFSWTDSTTRQSS
jgi:hypothetical protein